jgi:hypothetical protein
VYYQLQEYNESMVFALGAGKLFDIHHSGEFEETILGKSLAQTDGFPGLFVGDKIRPLWSCITLKLCARLTVPPQRNA